eukprot:COSAG02_NODE_3429_length_6760_cov_3.222339_1_plen_76_part_00
MLRRRERRGEGVLSAGGGGAVALASPRRWAVGRYGTPWAEGRFEGRWKGGAVLSVVAVSGGEEAAAAAAVVVVWG